MNFQNLFKIRNKLFDNFSKGFFCSRLYLNVTGNLNQCLLRFVKQPEYKLIYLGRTRTYDYLFYIFYLVVLQNSSATFFRYFVYIQVLSFQIYRYVELHSERVMPLPDIGLSIQEKNHMFVTCVVGDSISLVIWKHTWNHISEGQYLFQLLNECYFVPLHFIVVIYFLIRYSQ